MNVNETSMKMKTLISTEKICVKGGAFFFLPFKQYSTKFYASI